MYVFMPRKTDVRKLLPEGLLDDARAQEVAKAYNAQEGVIVEVHGAKRFSVTAGVCCPCDYCCILGAGVGAPHTR